MNFDNTAPLSIAFLGLLLGMRHATDPDHVIAVTTILSRERRFFAATRIGVVWGLGHTLTVLAVGAAIILFKLAIPTRLGLLMEFAVAIVLILLGTGSAARLIRMLIAPSARQQSTAAENLGVTSHRHEDGVFHQHPLVFFGNVPNEHDTALPGHTHDAQLFANTGLAGRHPLLRSFSVGLVHGLAGSAAIALVVLSAIPQPAWATLYLGIFCIGTILGMAVITTAIGAPFMFASRRMSGVHQALVMGSGLLSVGFGLFLAWQIGVVDHLFGIAPIWTPH
jgi:hypothetical protein